MDPAGRQSNENRRRRLTLVLSAELDLGATVGSVAHVHVPGPAADRAVLDVTLAGPAARLEPEHDPLAAVRAHRLGGELGRPVAQREVLLHWILTAVACRRRGPLSRPVRRGGFSRAR